MWSPIRTVHPLFALLRCCYRGAYVPLRSPGLDTPRFPRSSGCSPSTIHITEEDSKWTI